MWKFRKSSKSKQVPLKCLKEAFDADVLLQQLFDWFLDSRIFFEKNVHNLNNKWWRKTTEKKASLRYLRDKSSHEKSELVEQYTFLKVLLNENSANIRHFHDCKNLRGVVYMVINDFNFFSKGFMFSWKMFMQWYFKLAMDFENDNLWFTIKIGSW